MLSLGDDGHAPAFDKQVNIKTNKKQWYRISGMIPGCLMFLYSEKLDI